MHSAHTVVLYYSVEIKVDSVTSGVQVFKRTLINTWCNKFLVFGEKKTEKPANARDRGRFTDQPPTISLVLLHLFFKSISSFKVFFRWTFFQMAIVFDRFEHTTYRWRGI